MSINLSKIQIQKKKTEIQDRLDSEETETIVITGFKKLILRNHFILIDFQLSALNMKLNPVDMEKVQLARFQIENNLPIKKELLYQVASDYFQMELSEMEDMDRRKELFKRIRLIEVYFILIIRKLNLARFINYY